MKPTILLYDSGMGGLTVYDEIRKVLPNAYYLYCFDNAFFPYSEKSEAVLITRAVKIVQKIAEKRPLDMVVVACNTASTVVLPALREHFSFPIVGTVPAIKPAAEVSQTKTIGLLATKGTVTRPYVAELIEKYAQDCVVEKIGTTDLVEIVEEKQRTGKVDMNRLLNVVEEWKNHPTLDTIILGCTHFPLVKAELKQILPNVRYFVDPGIGIAKRVVSLLETQGVAQSQYGRNTPNEAFCTSQGDDLVIKQKIMQQSGFNQLSVLDI
ncbi:MULTISPECIES: glutamate racemase [Mannheimia]|uniref:Glutamate racemase n=1 Tax=Mannheimia pernigra TaxID=111844 RepID=A0ABD7A6M1_9PAST|nr:MULTISPECIES: glutamate racemase [Mannheimia]QLB41727.1 glutamate racemase [Mannheimia pernigra]QLB43857.1 glutamate racemase [Mannheimia pernigra]QTM01040.1 glutamate racemase [Mannheimia sp. ZY171111]